MARVERSEVSALRVRSEVRPSMSVRAVDQAAMASSARAWAQPDTPQEKVWAIHRLACDEEVAAQVTTDFLRRPAVSSQVRPEDKVRLVEEFTRDDDVAAEVTPTRRPLRPSTATRRSLRRCAA